MLLSTVWMLSAGEASAEFTAAAREIEGNGGRLKKSLHSYKPTCTNKSLMTNTMHKGANHMVMTIALVLMFHHSFTEGELGVHDFATSFVCEMILIRCSATGAGTLLVFYTLTAVRYFSF